MNNDTTDYSDEFSESGFWKIVRGAGRKVPFLVDALVLFYCLRDENTPMWVKATIVAALGYFIFPFDAIPDFVPVIGWLDDAGVIAAAIAAIEAHVTDEHREAAKRYMN